MHELAVLGVFILTLIRGLGLYLSLSLYKENRNSQTQFLVCGWFVWFLSSVGVFLAEIMVNRSMVEICILLSGITFVVGAFSVTAGFKSYYFPLQPSKVIIALCVHSCLIFLLYFMFNLEVAILINSQICNIGSVGSVGYDLIRHKMMRNILGKSVQWYYILYSVVIVLLVFSFTTNFQNQSVVLNTMVDPLSIVFFCTILNIISVLILIAMLNTEQDRTKRQYLALKDKYSHDLGNNVQILSTAMELIEVSSSKDGDTTKLWNTTHETLDKVHLLIKEIRKLKY